MARANRLRVDGGVFHVTHRCHNREFLLKFARDRDAYRSKLLEHIGQYEVWLLDLSTNESSWVASVKLELSEDFQGAVTNWMVRVGE